MAAGQDDSLCSVRDRVSRIGRATNDDSVERHTHRIAMLALLQYYSFASFQNARYG